MDLTGSIGPDALLARVERMGRCLLHRGPDDHRSWSEPSGVIALGQTRLAVVDLTESGAQPMVSASGRMVIVYNGECYETEALRAEVEHRGPPLRGRSDTEVVLEACERLGLEATLPRLVGMFAFAIFDRERRELHLVRDRVGIKPLAVLGLETDANVRRISFSSEVRSLRDVESLDIDVPSLAGYLAHGVLTAGSSIYRGIRQIAPGSVVTVMADGTWRTRRWWSLEQVATEGASARRVTRDPRDVIDEFEVLLGAAVEARMVADVPLGGFLSGGIDSSTVVALMQARSSGAIRTFTIGSTSSAHDESSFARAVAAHLGTEHTELLLTDAEVTDLVPGLLAELDEPFADPSYVPTWLVARLARRDVTVALSGDGGDEVFGGYTRHRVAASRFGSLLGLPGPIKRAAARGLQLLGPESWDRIAGILPASRRPGRPGEQVHRIAEVLSSRDIADLHRRLTTVWADPIDVLRGAVIDDERAANVWSQHDMQHLAPAERMLLLDTLGYLPDDILVKLDRATMAVSLEARVPLLDHRVIEAAWRLPLEQRIQHGRTKWVLREVLARHVPAHLFERPKRGFAQPIGAWLRGPLRPWAEDLLSDDAFAAHGLLDPTTVRRLWQEHQSGGRDHHRRLWTVLVLQAWLASQSSRSRS